MYFVLLASPRLEALTLPKARGYILRYSISSYILVNYLGTYSYRNANMHIILTWDHKNPQKYRSEARKNILANYTTIKFADVAVTEIDKKSDSHFEVITVGSANTHPDMESYNFYCLFCHGYEDRDAFSSGILAVSFVTIYTNSNTDVTTKLEPIITILTPFKFYVELWQIKRLVSNSQVNLVMVEFVNGSSKKEKFLTTVPDVYAVGDYSTFCKVTPSAITSGCNAAVMASAEIQAAKYSLPSAP
ncbi:hypothetical protein GGR53DRAFT_531332 [Hypoxylon sp. FL1150]|nr:hypothetical protein GGR53DRAFT_531332 [Hypoxylon sp. FL1150]